MLTTILFHFDEKTIHFISNYRCSCSINSTVPVVVCGRINEAAGCTNSLSQTSFATRFYSLTKSELLSEKVARQRCS